MFGYCIREEKTHVPILSANMWRDAWYAVQTVLKVRSFQIVVLQGLVGSIPWASMVFFTMWFELIGMMLHFLSPHIVKKWYAFHFVLQIDNSRNVGNEPDTSF